MNWIKVSDKLPEKGMCLVYGSCEYAWGKDPHVYTVWYSPKDNEFMHGSDEYLVEPTHWMELPEPPSQRVSVKHEDGGFTVCLKGGCDDCP